MAWQFVKRSGSFDDGERGIRLDTEDAEDLASVAMYHLLRLPQRYRDQPPYVKRVIVSKIITAWRKRLKYAEREGHMPKTFPPDYFSSPIRALEVDDNDKTDSLDRLPGRGGQLAEQTQQAFDSATVIALLPELPDSQRTVIELHFGLNGAKPCGAQRIATKLARSRYWVEARLQAGIEELRRLVSAKPLSAAVL